jgi:hypothetical protein
MEVYGQFHALAALLPWEKAGLVPVCKLRRPGSIPCPVWESNYDIWVAQPTAWSLYLLGYSSSQHGGRAFRTVPTCANFCITALIATARRSTWLVYFLLLCRRRRVTIALLCSPCRIVSIVTCEPCIMSDTIFTSNISSNVV